MIICRSPSCSDSCPNAGTPAVRSESISWSGSSNCSDVTASNVWSQTERPEPQILVSFCHPEEALPAYKERWTIETMFKGLKSSGFNIEDTHIVHINRIEQLFGVVIIAYTWAYLVGITANLKVKAIRILNNGRRAISLVKYGLNFIADTLLNPFRPTKINVFDFLSCT